MRSTTEQVLRRVRGVIETAGNERSNESVTRLILRALLFDGEPAPAWRDQAACADTPPAVFYPDPADHVMAMAAKRVCAGCPVRQACLADVLSWERPSRRHGIAGGRTPTERHRLVVARRREEQGGGVAA